MVRGSHRPLERAFAALTLLVLGTTCAEPTFGEGIGVPSISVWDIEEYDTLPIAITGVDRSASDPTDWTVGLQPTTELDVQLDGLMLCGEKDCVDLSGKLEGDEDLSLEELARLEQEVGAIAVVDSERFWVHAIYAWGADPRTTGHPWATVADAAGVLDEEAPFEEVCYPVESAPCDRQQQLRIEAVNADADEAWVEIANRSGTRLPLRGVALCVGQTCQRLVSEERIRGGESLVISLSGALPDEALDLRSAELELTNAAEVLLVAPGLEDALDDAATYWMSYLVYGGPGALQERASDEGLWNDPNTSAAEPSSGDVLRFTGADPAEPADWTLEAE